MAAKSKVTPKKAKPAKAVTPPIQALPPVSQDQPAVLGRRKGTKRIAILTGGGDCPGLNAVIRAVVKSAIGKHGFQCYGIEDGFHGLIYRRAHPLDSFAVSGILNQGGTILGSSNKDNPFSHTMHINGKDQTVDLSGQCIEYIRQMGWDCLVCIGGDGTLTMASQLAKKGVSVIGIPKTIDNDLSATDYTFGFATAVQTAVDALDRLHTTAMSHHRVQILEVMGRYAGHLALESGIAGGGDVILIPEIPYDIDVVCEECLRRSRSGKRFSIVVVAEGAKPIGGELTIAKLVRNMPDPIRLGGIANVIAEQICQRTGLEARATVLGHLQRGGSPIAVDRILSTRFGHHAVELIARGKYGRMVALQGSAIGDVALQDAIHKLKPVDLKSEMIRAARAVGTCFGDATP